MLFTRFSILPGKKGFIQYIFFTQIMQNKQDLFCLTSSVSEFIDLVLWILSVLSSELQQCFIISIVTLAEKTIIFQYFGRY